MKLAILLFPMLCVACATTSQSQLNQTLKHYIGQSSDQVQNQLNLNSMGYKMLGAPVHTPRETDLHTVTQYAYSDGNTQPWNQYQYGRAHSNTF